MAVSHCCAKQDDVHWVETSHTHIERVADAGCFCVMRGREHHAGTKLHNALCCLLILAAVFAVNSRGGLLE